MTSCFNDLPNCLLAEIFVRLGVNVITAHQYKLVCKRWHSVISEPYFADRFSEDEKLSSPLFHCYIGENVMPLYNCESYSYHLNKELSVDFINPDVVIEASSNDLLLCLPRTSSKWDDCWVCNPVTKKQVRLPTIPRFAPQVGDFNQRTYDGLTSKKSGEFAVVRIVDNVSETTIWIFSSNTPVWVEIENNSRFSSNTGAGVSFKGQLFWYESSIKVIIGIDPFNLSTKNPWFFIDLPKGCEDYFMDRYIGVCRKSLRFCQISVGRNKFTGEYDLILSVWDLNDSSEWILHHYVSLHIVYREYGYTNEAIRIIAHHPNDPDIIYLEIDSSKKGRFTTFSFNMSICEMIDVHPIPGYGGCNFFKAITYTVQLQPTPLPRLGLP